MSDALYLMVAVFLPPKELETLGEIVDEHLVQTPWGAVGPIARRQHEYGATFVHPYSGLPSRSDPRSTIYAAKELGARWIVGWDAAIALNPLLARGQSVVLDDYMDWTRHQPTTCFTDKGIGYIQQVPAFCPDIHAALCRALPRAVPCGAYVAVDGPRRETAAEARMFRLWGGDVIGQNLVPEAALAKELEMCYAGVVTVAERSADLPPVEVLGAVRQGLYEVVMALPDLLRELEAQPRGCDCNQAQAGPRKRGVLEQDWRRWF